MPTSIAAAQVPAPGELNVDHVAHFVPKMDNARRELERLGFKVTPFSSQSHRVQPDHPLEPAGAGNCCVMLERGYLEFLTPTGDTPIAAQLRAGIQRYVGMHLIAFGSASPKKDHARLAQADFSPLEPLALQRSIDTEPSQETARFTVVRVPPGTMAEGRIQFCQHLTPQWLWQNRWLEHPNHAVALKGVIVCVADPREAAERFGRFTGLAPITSGNWHCVLTSRGYLLFADATSLTRRFSVTPPSLPWLAGYVLESRDLEATANHLQISGAQPRTLDHGRVLVELRPALGGIAIFEAANSGMLDFDRYAD